jgi:PBP1b-binding outer membrane lipoprotein LpoB
MKKMAYILVVVVLTIFVTSCSSDQPSVQVVNAYLQAVVDQDDVALQKLVCEEWQFDAMMEMDSFLAVSPQLEDVSCSVVDETEGSQTVNCTGSILATYNEEEQKIDLSLRNYIVNEISGEWLVCGHQ